MDQDVAHLWQLVNELSEQLTANRAMTEALKNQALNVKGQAVHNGVGFPLRRFNIDISDEQFTSELERFASHLVLENQNLAYENKQLNLLLKEYEQTLEGVMGKFRGVCHAATQHELTLHQYYTSLLQQLQTTHSTSSLHDSTTLSTLLQRLSTLIRAALRSINGEDDEFEHPGFDMSPVSEKPASLADAIADIQNMTTSSTTSGPRSAGTRRSHAKWLGDQGVSGGYSGKSMARLDWSIEREGEIIRLEEENRLLREMLGVSKDVEPTTLLQQLEGRDGEASEVETKPDQTAKPDVPETKAAEPTKENKLESEKADGYVVEDGTKEEIKAEASSSSKTPPSSEETEVKKVHHDLDDSATAEEEVEMPSSPAMTAAASLTRSLSTSPNSRFKASPKLSKYATYSGGMPKSPTINRSHSSVPNVTQSVSSPNASLANIFPRQAKTEPTTATTTTVELEDKTVEDEARNSKATSQPTGSSAPPNVDTNGISKSRIEIKKVNTPPLPGSPLGKTPPKTGITFDHAVESRAASAKKKDDKASKQETGEGESEKQSPKKEDAKTQVAVDAKSRSPDTDKDEEDVEKPSYADVAKEDPAE